MKETRKNRIEELLNTFAALPEDAKDFVAGYVIGKEEERAKWEKKQTA